MTARERRAFLIASCLLLLASAGRWAFDARAREPLFPADSLGVVDSLLAGTRDALEEAEQRSRPLEEGETLDPNRAPAEELDRLPGVGPTTADRIVAERESGGAFRTITDLSRVRGIGSATVERMAPHLEIGPIPVGMARAFRSEREAGTRSSDRSPNPVTTAPSTANSGAAATAATLDLNRATAAELETLRGIGPALAGRIIDHRATHGRFRTVEELTDVRGIGPATLESLRPHLRVGP